MVGEEDEIDEVGDEESCRIGFMFALFRRYNGANRTS